MSSKIYNVIGWKPWALRSNYDYKGECQKCPICGSKNFTDQITDTIANHVCEQYTYCKKCGERVNFCAYGSYDPCFKFADRSFEMWLERIQYKIRGLTTP